MGEANFYYFTCLNYIAFIVSASSDSSTVRLAMPHSVILEEPRSTSDEEDASSLSDEVTPSNESRLTDEFLTPEKKSVAAAKVGKLDGLTGPTTRDDGTPSATPIIATPSSLAHSCAHACCCAELVDFFRAELRSVREEMVGFVQENNVFLMQQFSIQWAELQALTKQMLVSTHQLAAENRALRAEVEDLKSRHDQDASHRTTRSR